MSRIHSLERIWSPFFQSFGTLYAAGVCFYMLLSLLPGSVFLLSLLNWAPGLERAIRQMVLTAVPGPLLPLTDWIFSAGSARLMPLSGLLTLWSASRGLHGLSRGLYGMLGIQPAGSAAARRLRSVAQALLLPLGAGLLYCVLSPLRLRQRAAAALLCVSLLVLQYRLLLGAVLDWSHCLAGALFAAGGWVLVSLGISLPLGLGLRTQPAGPAGLVLLGALWLQGVLVFILWGGLFARLLAEGSYHPIQWVRDFFRNVHE